ncbi:MAG TPA: hypothetical protein VGO91_02240 [Pyrinomonadaceae bacterium]|jgi:hypothetical protein|nr:hypothetical protein [Pyrinomonadaceae bacterium]
MVNKGYWGWLKIAPIWVALMSGSFSLIREVVGYYQPEHTDPKPLFRLLGWTCFFISAVIAWIIKQRELVDEKAKNARPEITGEILEVYFQPTAALSKVPVLTDLYITIKVYLVNTRPKQTTIKKYALMVNTDEGEYYAEETPIDGDLRLKREQRHQVILGLPASKIEPVLDELPGLGHQRHIALTEGNGREGWLRFVLAEVALDTTKIQEGITTLTIVDAFGTQHKITAYPPFNRTGELVSHDMEEIHESVKESKKEKEKLKAQLEELKKLKLIINTDHQSEVRINRHWNVPVMVGVEQSESDEWHITAHLRMQLENNALANVLVKKLEASLVRKTKREEEKGMPKTKTSLIPLLGIEELVRHEVLAGRMTEQYWYSYEVDIPARYVKRLDSTCFLRVTMEAMRQPPSSIDLDVDWEEAKIKGTTFLTPRK